MICSKTQLTKKTPDNRVINIFPITKLENLVDCNGNNIKERIDDVNHIFLPFTNTRAETRLLVPDSYRRKGLWITYIHKCGQVITEYYTEEATNDASWSKQVNWTLYMDTKLIRKYVNKVLSWHKED